MSTRAVAAGLCLVMAGCGSRPAPEPRPSIEFLKIPRADPGGPDTVDTIEGRVAGARAGQRIVLYARSGQWWVQPLATAPFTEMRPDGRWKSTTHLGLEYAALLAEPDYRPPATLETLPEIGGGVAALAVTRGFATSPPPMPPRVLRFGGFDWDVRRAPSHRGGTTNVYDPANAWIDGTGALHLRIVEAASGIWSCAEVVLAHGLGYGTYRFTVRDVSHLEPSAVLSLFTRDESAPAENHREVTIEIGRWGEPRSKNAQYVVQPYYVPANVTRFDAPAGPLTHSFRWEPGRAAFRTVRGRDAGASAEPVAEHVFTSGVPAPGNEAVYLSFYVFASPAHPLQRGAEVVIEAFEYLP